MVLVGLGGDPGTSSEATVESVLMLGIPIPVCDGPGAFGAFV